VVIGWAVLSIRYDALEFSTQVDVREMGWSGEACECSSPVAQDGGR
jgi:hypothetical protein